MSRSTWVHSERLERPGGIGACWQAWRHPGAGRLRRAGHRGQDRAAALCARAAHPLLWPVPGDAGDVHRVCAQRPRPGGGQQHGVQPQDAGPGHQPDARSAGDRGHGRHDAAGLVAVRVAARQPGGRSVRAGDGRAKSATATAGSSTTATAPAAEGGRAWSSAASRPTAGWWRSPSWPATCIRGCWARSSTRSFARARTGRIRCSGRFWRRPAQTAGTRTLTLPLEGPVTTGDSI